MSDVPPVDRSKRQLVSGLPVPEDESHRELRSNGQQRDYVVLSPEERARGFVRPVRSSYVHVGKDPKMAGTTLVRPGEGGCGATTSMSPSIAETYARDPKFYTHTFCWRCGKHPPLSEFYWKGTTEVVGS